MTGSGQGGNGAAGSLRRLRSETLAKKSGPVQKCPGKKNSWIEITLEDEYGNRVPGEDYLVIAPDGTETPGQLDANGFVRIEGLDPGTCRITFPLRADREWRGKK